MAGLNVKIRYDSVKDKTKSPQSEPKSHLPSLEEMLKIRNIQVLKMAHALRGSYPLLN
jgi:hypothetical protein